MVFMVLPKSKSTIFSEEALNSVIAVNLDAQKAATALIFGAGRLMTI
jgi:hypothetical protein